MFSSAGAIHHSPLAASSPHRNPAYIHVMYVLHVQSDALSVNRRLSSSSYIQFGWEQSAENPMLLLSSHARSNELTVGEGDRCMKAAAAATCILRRPGAACRYIYILYSNREWRCWDSSYEETLRTHWTHSINLSMDLDRHCESLSLNS